MYLQFVYGWGGKSFMSAGFIKLVGRLREIGYEVDDTVPWDSPDHIAVRIKQRPVGLIGHSMGANAITWAAEMTDAEIDILIAYDPSLGTGIMSAKPPSPIRKNVRKTICYQGTRPRIAGGAEITGHNVETIMTDTSHMGLQWDEALHQYTVDVLQSVRVLSS